MTQEEKIDVSDKIILEQNNKNNILLQNELLSKLVKTPPNLSIKYENEELNKFKDEMLLYINERNNQIISLINFFQEKINQTKEEYTSQLNLINQNYESILSSQASILNKVDKISNFELFMNKTNDQIITHEIRINNLSQDFIKSVQKYDKIYLDNLELPGYIGKFAKFKNCQSFFDFLIREIDKINLYKEKNNLDIKNNKDRLENTIKSFNLLFKNNNEAQMKYIRQINEKNFKECKDMNEALNNRVCDLRIENAKYSIDLIKKSEEMGKDWNKILTIKEEMIDMVNEKINSFKKIFNGNNTIFNEFRKEYEEFKGKINDIINYFKEFRYLIENNNCQEKNNNNINNCNNYTGCYINSNLPSEKKSFKHFSKFAKRAKSKNSKKNFIKSFMTINGNKSNYENNENGNTGLIHIECISKEKKNKIENNLKKNAYIQKGEPRSSKSVTKIEINSLNKVCASHDEIKNNNLKLLNNNINNNSNEIQIKINEEENKSEKNSNNDNNSNNNSNIKINREIINLSENKEKDKEKLIIKINKKSRKSFAPSSKSIISYESENNNINDISNITSSHKDDLLTNSSLYSTNSFNVNRFNLYDNNILEANQQVIKELASELEQSTNKKDMINSNKKKIEENFKINRSKISKLNLNKTTNIIDVTNSTEKTDDIFSNNNNINKYASNNNINISISGVLNKNNNADNNVSNVNNNNININTINKKMDLFDKKLFSLETLLKEKIIEILYQMEKLQNFFNISFNPNNIPNNINNINNNINNFKYPISSARIKSLLNQNSKEASVNFNNFNNVNNLNINTTPNSFLMKNNDINNDYINNINKRNSQDDYFIGCSIKRLAPIIEIDVNNLQFSPAPTRTQYKIFSSKKKESRNKWNKSGMSTNYKDIKIKRNENKENINLNSNNNNGTQIRLFGKGANNLTMGGVNKWINLNKLINYEKPNKENKENLTNTGII